MTDVQIYDDHLTVERNLPAPPEKVWTYLVDPQLRQKWFCGGTTDTQVGGTILLDFDLSRLSSVKTSSDTVSADPVIMEGTITAFDPPNRLAFTWFEDSGAQSHVTITLTARDSGTTLHLIHDRMIKPEDKWGVAAGWHAHLDLLLDLLSGRQPRDFWQHHDPLEARYKTQLSL